MASLFGEMVRVEDGATIYIAVDTSGSPSNFNSVLQMFEDFYVRDVNFVLLTFDSEVLTVNRFSSATELLAQKIVPCAAGGTSFGRLFEKVRLLHGDTRPKPALLYIYTDGLNQDHMYTPDPKFFDVVWLLTHHDSVKTQYR